MSLAFIPRQVFQGNLNNSTTTATYRTLEIPYEFENVFDVYNDQLKASSALLLTYLVLAGCLLGPTLGLFLLRRGTQQWVDYFLRGVGVTMFVSQASRCSCQ